MSEHEAWKAGALDALLPLETARMIDAEHVQRFLKRNPYPAPHNPACGETHDHPDPGYACPAPEGHARWCNVLHAPGTSPCKKVL